MLYLLCTKGFVRTDIYYLVPITVICSQNLPDTSLYARFSQ